MFPLKVTNPKLRSRAALDSLGLIAADFLKELAANPLVMSATEKIWEKSLVEGSKN
jgi:hypothetical protein